MAAVQTILTQSFYDLFDVEALFLFDIYFQLNTVVNV